MMRECGHAVLGIHRSDVYSPVNSWKKSGIEFCKKTCCIYSIKARMTKRDFGRVEPGHISQDQPTPTKRGRTSAKTRMTTYEKFQLHSPYRKQLIDDIFGRTPYVFSP